MKKRLVPILALSACLLTSCGGSASWTWAHATEDGALKYCLLIGQIDHNDSAARTAGIREALHTRSSTHDTNANSESPVDGSLTVSGTSYTVSEIEHGEQKNTAGATWDAQTATSTTEAWFNKHGNDIDFIVSNNDGMAEGAIGASNWIEGTPIFGYDSNASTLEYINQGKIMGTINQNASAQAAGIFMLTRNAIDDIGVENVTTKGFSAASTNGYGQISATYNLNATNKSMLVDNFAITKSNVSSYLGKTAADLIDSKVTTGTTAKKTVFMDYYSNSDTFLNSNMDPLFKLYDDKFNLEVTYAAGDGNNESSVLDKINKAYDGYCINMVKTTNANNYLDAIASQVGATEAAPSSVPVIFWNRQATDTKGVVDSAVMQDARFKYVYYVGFDAIQGGQLQGQMIVDYLNAQTK